MVLLYFLETVRKCFKCYNSDSWAKCDNWDEVTCLGDQDTCGYLYSKQGAVETFRRDCFMKANCKDCAEPGFSKCNVECCDGDKCNDRTPSGAITVMPKLLFILVVMMSSIIHVLA